MKKHYILAAIIISLLIISGGVIFSACASVAAVGQTGNIEAQVNTAVAATMIQYMVETQVAAQSVALASTPAAQAQATQPPAPTPTPVPTEPAQPPTVAPTVEAPQPTAAAPAAPSPTAPPPPPPPSGPKITADQNTNCRVGPSTGYKVQTYFFEGSVSTVEGRDSGKDWWYIVSPDGAGEYCWVWDGSTTVQGDTSTVPVVAAPSDVYPKTSNPYYVWNVYKPYGNCTNNYSNCCGKADCCGKVVVCKPNKQYCNPNNWGTCYPYANCTCKPVYQNPCKKGGCPPVTQVNYKNYCKKYPECCGEG